MKWWMNFVIIAVIGIAGFAFYKGYWNVKDVERGAKKSLSKVKQATGMKRNLTKGAGGAAACRDNLKTIESIKRQISDTKGSRAASWTEVNKHFKSGKAPRCPDGGEYKLNSIGFVATCSIGNNDTQKTDDDHIISGF